MTDTNELTVDQEQEERGAKKRTNLIIIIAVLVVLLVAVCVVFYLSVFSRGASPVPDTSSRPSPGLKVELPKTLVVNIKEGHLLSCGMVFEIVPRGGGSKDSPLDDWRSLDEYSYSIVPEIIDVIRLILSEKSKFELESSSGQKGLKQEIARELNEKVLLKSRVTAIYFEPFTIQ